MIKCSCGEKDCKIKITFDSGKNYARLFFTDKTGAETCMHINPNSIQELVKELKRVLNDMVFGDN